MPIEWKYFGIVLLINLLGALLFVIFSDKNQKRLVGFFFVALPVLGFVIYFFMRLVLRILEDEKRYDRANFVNRTNIKKEVLHPEIEKELNVVAVQDALVISKNTEKRSLLMEQIKLDMNRNYKSLLVASDDRDSESAHYVATSKMSMQKKLYDVVLTATKRYKENENDAAATIALLDALSELIESNLLAFSEEKLYLAQYCGIAEAYYRSNDVTSDAVYYELFYKYMYRLERYRDMIGCWNRCEDAVKTQYTYIKILEVFYNMGDKESFYRTIDELCASNITLFSENLEILRFWLNEREKDVI